MSAGLFRKQYTALSALADNLGADYTDPEGSFNQKFCALCAIMIEDQGGTFKAVQGSFHTRKSIYLWQLATALNLTIATSGNTFLKSAFAIWEEYSDGTAPDDGASLDWRVYQFLLHATEVGPPDKDQLVQWLNYLKDDGITLNDKQTKNPPLAEPTLVGVNVAKFSAVGETITTKTIDVSTLGNELHWSAWVRIDASTGGHQYILGYGDNIWSGSVRGPSWMFREDTQSIRFYVATTTADAGVATTSLTLGQWYFIESHYDGSRISIAVDGVESQAVTGDWELHQPEAFSVVRFGAPNSGAYEMNGAISCPDLGSKLFQGSFAEGFGTSYDKSGMQNDITLSTYTWEVVSGTGPASANHRDGFAGSLIFNGTSTLIRMNGADLSSGFTFRCSGKFGAALVDECLLSVGTGRILLACNSSGQFYTRCGSGSFQVVASAGVQPYDEFDLLFSQDGATGLSLEIKLNGSYSAYTSTGAGPEAVVAELVVGSGGGPAFFDGYMDRASIYDVFNYEGFPSATTAKDSLGLRDGDITDGALRYVPPVVPVVDVSPLAQYIGMGDSNTAWGGDSGYVPTTGAARFCWEALNAGVSGDGLYQMEARFQTDVIDKYNPYRDNYVSIWSGYNDRTGDPVALMESLGRMCDDAVAAGFKVILVEYYIWNAASEADQKGYNTALESFAADNNYPIVDTRVLHNGGEYIDPMYMSDPVGPPQNEHMNQAAMDVVAGLMIDQLNSYYPNGFVQDFVAGNGVAVTNTGCSSSGEHNGSECGVVRTSTLVPELDGIPWYWADYVAHPNGLYGLWLKFVKDPSCKVESSGLYADGGVPGAGYTPDLPTLEKLYKYWAVGDCGTAAAPYYITLVVTGGTSAGTYAFVKQNAEVGGEYAWYSTNNLISSVAGQWQIDLGGTVVQFGSVTNSPVPPYGEWPDLGGGTVELIYGNETGYQLLVDGDTYEQLVDADTGEFLGEQI